MNQQTPVFLASASPRRCELLTQLGLAFKQYPVDIDESVLANEVAEAYVERLAKAKAFEAYQQLVSEQAQDFYVIGSDTSVVLEQRIFGKPTDLDDFRNMMTELSGRWHTVMTGVSVVHHTAIDSEPVQRTMVVRTGVRFRPLSKAKIEAYWRTGEPQDKAGGYGIQGRGALLVERIDGSYSNVVGLPLSELAEMLEQLELNVWDYQQNEQNPSGMESELSK